MANESIFAFGNSLRTFETALTLRAQRAELIGANIANADTPGYKARDIDFSAVMAKGAEHGPRSGAHSGTDVAIGYRVPTQSSLDENTVETHVEQSAFTDNAIRYQATLQLLNGRLRHLTTAVTGQSR